MSLTNERVLERLRERFAEHIQSADQFRDELTVIVAKSRIAEICLFLRDTPELAFDCLSNLTGCDWPRQAGTAPLASTWCSTRT